MNDELNLLQVFQFIVAAFILPIFLLEVVMERAQGEDQCQHPGCKCPRPSTGDYCGDACANAQGGGMDEECRCGHPECG